MNTSLLQPDNHNKKYEALFVEIDSGQIKLPMFQREFVWDKEQSAKLIDSILKGFPIGTFIFWKTKETLRSYKEIGNHTLPETPQGDYAQYILDGQQRITSLYAIRKGIRITKDGKEIDYKDIYIDLDYDPLENEQIVVTEMEEERDYVSVHDVLTQKIGVFYKEFSQAKAEKLEEYKSKLTSYDFSSITIKDYPIEIACEVFSRINTGGKSLTVFEIMVAKTYDEQRGFDLSEQYDILRNGSDEEENCLEKAKFETIPHAIIMQCVAAITLKAVKSKDILKIQRETFIDNWEPMKKSLFTAIDFVRSGLRIPVSQLLPYPAVLLPLTYFFFSIQNKKPNNKQARLLEQFVYWVGLTERYSSATESKIGEDLNKMEQIIKGLQPNYPSTELTVTPEEIAERRFSAGNAYCKTILCLFAYQQPLSFDNNDIVNLDNSNLKIASSRNYHHFFPKAYLNRLNNGAEPNLVANITLIDGYSNKHKIGGKAPSDYIGIFSAMNEELAETMKKHLVQDMEKFGVLTNDYDTFIGQRSKAIAKKLNHKLMPLQEKQAIAA